MYRYVIETLSGSPTKETQEENKQQKIQQLSYRHQHSVSAGINSMYPGINPASSQDFKHSLTWTGNKTLTSKVSKH